MLHRFFLCKKTKTKFRSTAIYNCSCLCGKLKDWPIEAAVKLIFVTVGFAGEIYTGFSAEGHFVNLGNGQHATMFFFFGLSGVIDILLYFKVPLPPDMDYIAGILAFICEYVLFKFHLHGRTDLDVLLHTLLIYTIAASILAMLAELKYRDNILCALARSYFTLLQGTWFWQVGWILYPPFKHSFHWDQEDHEQMMIATMIFAWHGAVDFLLVLSIGGLVAFFQKKCGHWTGPTYSGLGESMTMKRLHVGVNGDTIRLGSDEESGGEIEVEIEPMLP